MMLNVKKQLWSAVCVVLPGVGFVTTCFGAYLVSLQTGDTYTWSVIPAYVLIVIGFLAILVGVFWTLCHSVKGMYHRRGNEQHIHVYTTERPSSFPPSYDESQQRHVCPQTASECVVVVDGVDMVLSLAPPLYNQDSTAAPDCTWSWEQPPRYSQVERQVDAEERRELSSGH
ncbi:transmembrane protein 252-like [Aulostomus maculatus]